jgi:hypothetical protein
MHPNAKGTLHNQNINIRLRYLRLHNIPILLTRVIPRIQYLNPINLNNKHRRPHNMPRDIRRDLYSLLLQLYTKVYGTDLLHRVADLLLCEEGFFVADFKCVADEVMVDVLGGFCHVDFFLVVVCGEEVG